MNRRDPASRRMARCYGSRCGTRGNDYPPEPPLLFAFEHPMPSGGGPTPCYWPKRRNLPGTPLWACWDEASGREPDEPGLLAAEGSSGLSMVKYQLSVRTFVVGTGERSSAPTAYGLRSLAGGFFVQFVQQSQTQNGRAVRIFLLAAGQGLTAISIGSQIHFFRQIRATLQVLGRDV